MTPSNDTIRAVLALPLEARRLLAEKAQGLGWWVCFDAGHHYAHQTASSDGRDVHPLSAWLPCAPTEILRVWAEHADDPLYAVDEEACWLFGLVLVVDPGDTPTISRSHDGTLDGMLRAAVDCWPG